VRIMRTLCAWIDDSVLVTESVLNWNIATLLPTRLATGVVRLLSRTTFLDN
jgi:hypothetical protein